MTMSISLHKSSNKINAKRGIRQGDVISPKLFTLVLEDIFKNLKWETKGLVEYMVNCLLSQVRRDLGNNQKDQTSESHGTSTSESHGTNGQI